MNSNGFYVCICNKHNGSSNNLPHYPPDRHQCDNAVYWRTGDFAQGLTYLHCPLKKDWLILTPEYRMTTTVKPNRV